MGSGLTRPFKRKHDSRSRNTCRQMVDQIRINRNDSIGDGNEITLTIKRGVPANSLRTKIGDHLMEKLDKLKHCGNGTRSNSLVGKPKEGNYDKNSDKMNCSDTRHFPVLPQIESTGACADNDVINLLASQQLTCHPNIPPIRLTEVTQYSAPQTDTNKMDHILPNTYKSRLMHKPPSHSQGNRPKSVSTKSSTSRPFVQKYILPLPGECFPESGSNTEMNIEEIEHTNVSRDARTSSPPQAHCSKTVPSRSCDARPHIHKYILTPPHGIFEVKSDTTSNMEDIENIDASRDARTPSPEYDEMEEVSLIKSTETEKDFDSHEDPFISPPKEELSGDIDANDTKRQQRPDKEMEDLHNCETDGIIFVHPFISKQSDTITLRTFQNQTEQLIGSVEVRSVPSVKDLPQLPVDNTRDKLGETENSSPAQCDSKTSIQSNKDSRSFSIESFQDSTGNPDDPNDFPIVDCITNDSQISGLGTDHEQSADTSEKKVFISKDNTTTSSPQLNKETVSNTAEADPMKIRGHKKLPPLGQPSPGAFTFARAPLGGIQAHAYSHTAIDDQSPDQPTHDASSDNGRTDSVAVLERVNNEDDSDRQEIQMDRQPDDVFSQTTEKEHQNLERASEPCTLGSPFYGDEKSPSLLGEQINQGLASNVEKQAFEEGLNPSRRDGGVSFFVPLAEGGLQPAVQDKDVSERITKGKKCSLNYEERMLLADHNRQAHLSKRKEFAVKDIKTVKSSTMPNSSPTARNSGSESSLMDIGGDLEDSLLDGL